VTNRVELSISERFPFAERHEFAAAGAYESLVGRAHFAVGSTASTWPRRSRIWARTSERSATRSAASSSIS
jgi:hypothetical protein